MPREVELGPKPRELTKSAEQLAKEYLQDPKSTQEFLDRVIKEGHQRLKDPSIDFAGQAMTTQEEALRMLANDADNRTRRLLGGVAWVSSWANRTAFAPRCKTCVREL